MRALRWCTRILGVLVVGLFLLFIAGDGFDPLKLTSFEIPLVLALFIALTGMLLLWRRELLGGVMVIGGMISFYSINFVASGRLPSGFVFPVCFVPGILAVVCWWTARKSRSQLHR